MSPSPPKPKPLPSVPPGPVIDEAAKMKRERAERAEVAGRHANSGQKDHKGAR
jgi:hypothetical protein